MKNLSRLTRAVLEDALGQIVDRLFLDINPLDCPAELRDQEIYNPEKDWDLDDLDFIAGLLRTAGLAPNRPRRPAVLASCEPSWPRPSFLATPTRRDSSSVSPKCSLPQAPINKTKNLRPSSPSASL